MKNLWIVSLIIILLLVSGCTRNNSNLNENSKQQKENEIPALTQEEALKIASEASGKYHDITLYGSTIPNCTIENNELIEIDGNYYNYLGGCIDTLEEFDAYLGNVFTDKSIKAVMESENIIINKGKLLRLYADAGGGKDWRYPKVITMNKNYETAEVEIEVPSVYDDEKYIIQINYIYIQNQGWLIDTETPFEDLY